MTAASLAKGLSVWAAQSPDCHEARTVEHARTAFVDVIACMLAGTADPTPVKVARAVGPTGSGESTIFGATERLASPWAGLVNATAAHALDFDDSGTTVLGHATAVLAPALFALAEEEDLPGHRVVDAYVVGLELQDRLGRAANPDHYAAGWHTTSTLCAIGSAGACARLLGLDADGVLAALSNGFSMAGGSKKQFGSPMKPVHAGLAAQHAIQAALLARAGVHGDADPLEGPWGLFDLFRADVTPERLLDAGADLGSCLAIDGDFIQTKRYPCCAAAHKTLDGILALRERIGAPVSTVARVETWLPPSLYANLRFERPADEMQARFSLHYCASRVLDAGRLSLDDLTAARVREHATEEALARFVKHERDADGLSPMRAPVETTIQMESGAVLSTVVDDAKGSAANPLTEDELRDKFGDCCAFAGMAGRTDALFDLAHGIPEAARMRDVMRAIAEIGRDAGRTPDPRPERSEARRMPGRARG